MKKRNHLSSPSYIALIIGLMLTTLFAITFISYWQQAQKLPEQIMSNDIALLATILNSINDDCGILEFKSGHNEIDFLNVISFAGSEVGPLNLKFPEKWQGPYLKDNLTMQEKLYQIVKTKKGYFVLPGNGVELANGKIIGKDIIIDKNTDIIDLIHNKSLVDSSGKPLALPVKTLSDKSTVPLDELFMYASSRLPYVIA